MSALRRVHEMPFGAQPLAEGGVRFGLWAPGAGAVELVLEGQGRRRLPMTAAADGWFEIVAGEAHPGTRYRFRVDDDLEVPDPASRYQPADVHGPSEVVDPTAHEWRDGAWTGRPWEQAVVYELHVGTFSATHDFAGVEARLDHLAALGVTAVELMPVADFPGERNWGYDGVLPFAPDSAYGSPAGLKSLVEAAHARGLMVVLDVVYNHFGPDGNYLHAYASDFFTDRHETPWGAAINFDGTNARWVREFFIHNALYWLEEYHLDGLRLDAVHAIVDDSVPDILTELAARVRAGPGAKRHVHLVLENDANAARYLERGADGRPRLYDAQWNDDVHHALHVLLTGERDGYYVDYADDPVTHAGRCLAEGFAYQGELSVHRGERRGEPSAALPPTAFVSFLQNHDQIGNRPFGERIGTLAAPEALRAATVARLLAPSPPLLFMGEEFAATTPFLFFCDFEGRLAADVTAGRRAEFASFEGFAAADARARIPDPNAAETFGASCLDWRERDAAGHAEHLGLCSRLLALRHERIVPLLSAPLQGSASYEVVDDAGLVVRWRLARGARLTLVANLTARDMTGPELERPPGERLFSVPASFDIEASPSRWPPWSAAYYLEAGSAS